MFLSDYSAGAAAKLNSGKKVMSDHSAGGTEDSGGGSASTQSTPRGDRRDAVPTKRNPFESPLLRGLASNIVTPGIFRTASRRATAIGQRNKRDGDVRGGRKKAISNAVPSASSFWSIEHMAAILPVEIHERELLRQQVQANPEYEAKVHAAIDSYWSRNTIYAPSPEVESTTNRRPRGANKRNSSFGTAGKRLSKNTGRR